MNSNVNKPTQVRARLQQAEIYVALLDSREEQLKFKLDSIRLDIVLDPYRV